MRTAAILLRGCRQFLPDGRKSALEMTTLRDHANIQAEKKS